MRGLGLVATQTLVFLFAGLDGRAAVMQRRGYAHAGVSAGYHQLIRADLAVPGG